MTYDTDWVSAPFLPIHVQLTLHHYVVQASVLLIINISSTLLLCSIAKSDVVTIEPPTPLHRTKYRFFSRQRIGERESNPN